MPLCTLYTDEKLGWGSLIENLTVIDADGGHSTIAARAFCWSRGGGAHPLHKREGVIMPDFSTDEASRLWDNNPTFD
jgi:hypothetical protein